MQEMSARFSVRQTASACAGAQLAGWATLGMLVAFVQYTDRAFQPVRDIRAFVQALDARERARLDRIYAP